MFVGVFVGVLVGVAVGVSVGVVVGVLCVLAGRLLEDRIVLEVGRLRYYS